MRKKNVSYYSSNREWLLGIPELLTQYAKKKEYNTNGLGDNLSGRWQEKKKYHFPLDFFFSKQNSKYKYTLSEYMNPTQRQKPLIWLANGLNGIENSFGLSLAMVLGRCWEEWKVALYLIQLHPLSLSISLFLSLYPLELLFVFHVFCKHVSF